MENELFESDGWDQHDTMVFGFSKPVMNRDFGPLKKGQAFDWANIDYGKGILEFSMDNGPTYKFKIRLELVHQIEVVPPKPVAPVTTSTSKVKK